MIQPKYSPQEALERVKLMMKYDMGKTLNENIKETIFLNEQANDDMEEDVEKMIDYLDTPVFEDDLLKAKQMLEKYLKNSKGKDFLELYNSAGWAPTSLKTTMKLIATSDVKAVRLKQEIIKLINQIQEGAPTPTPTPNPITNDKTSYPACVQVFGEPTANTKGYVSISGTGSWKDYLFYNNGRVGKPDGTSDSYICDGNTIKIGKSSSRGKTGGGSTYKPCSGTYEYGCKSDVIAQAQKCLGLVTDGKFGPKTQAALATKGFSKFTDTDIQKICSSVEPVNQNPYAAYQNADVEDGDVDVTNASGSKTSVVNTPEGE